MTVADHLPRWVSYDPSLSTEEKWLYSYLASHADKHGRVPASVLQDIPLAKQESAAEWVASLVEADALIIDFDMFRVISSPPAGRYEYHPEHWESDDRLSYRAVGLLAEIFVLGHGLDGDGCTLWVERLQGRRLPDYGAVHEIIDELDRLGYISRLGDGRIQIQPIGTVLLTGKERRR